MSNAVHDPIPPLAETIAVALGTGGDYLSCLRALLTQLKRHYGASAVGIRLYAPGHQQSVFALGLPENRHLAAMEPLFAQVQSRKSGVVHSPERQSSLNATNQLMVPALAAPVMRGEQVAASVVLLRGATEAFTLAELAALTEILPLMSGLIDDAIMQRTLIAGYLKTIESLALALEAKDTYTRGHSNMVAAYSLAIAQRLGLSDEDQELLALGAIMHDLGKIGVPDHILTKPGPLTPEEFELMKKHPVLGEQILAPLDHPHLDMPRQIVRHHHERLDGRGYPDGLSGSEIPVLVRIVTVADAWDAMTSDRPYRKALSYEVASQELLRRSHDMWDRGIVEIHLRIVYPEALLTRTQKLQAVSV